FAHGLQASFQAARAGTAVVRCLARDSQGRTGESPRTIWVLPTVPIVAIVAPAAVSSFLPVDPIGLTQLLWFVDSACSGTGKLLRLTACAPGEHEVEVRYQDARGRANAATLPLRVVLPVTVTSFVPGLHTLTLAIGTAGLQATTSCTFEVVGDVPQIVAIRTVDSAAVAHELDVGLGGGHTIEPSDRAIQVIVFNPSGRAATLRARVFGQTSLAFSQISVYENGSTTATWAGPWAPDAAGFARAPLPASAVYATVEATIAWAGAGKRAGKTAQLQASQGGG
ncbi:MAG: hypothetical protein HY814_07615, partial [Candidatus Riflebacteria bacterium]|nr:hypothetical protein [Candidatus Riflebacteria bacterium]